MLTTQEREKLSKEGIEKMGFWRAFLSAWQSHRLLGLNERLQGIFCLPSTFLFLFALPPHEYFIVILLLFYYIISKVIFIRSSRSSFTTPGKGEREKTSVPKWIGYLIGHPFLWAKGFPAAIFCRLQVPRMSKTPAERNPDPSNPILLPKSDPEHKTHHHN